METTGEAKTPSGRNKGRPAAFRIATLPNELGQALAEIALVLPVLLALLIGAIEFGRLAYASMEVSNAAHAGVQYGAQSHATAADNAGMQQAALNDGKNVAGPSATATHFCACSNGSAAPNCALSDCSSSRLILYVKVTTSATLNPLLHYPGIPSSFNLAGQAVLRVAQ